VHDKTFNKHWQVWSDDKDMTVDVFNDHEIAVAFDKLYEVSHHKIQRDKVKIQLQDHDLSGIKAHGSSPKKDKLPSGEIELEMIYCNKYDSVDKLEQFIYTFTSLYDRLEKKEVLHAAPATSKFIKG